MAGKDTIRDIRHFTGASGMQLDADERIVKPEESREIWNARLIGSDGNNVGSMENILGTEYISAFLSLTGSNKVIGRCKDVENNAVYYFVYNSLGNHNIMRYNATERTVDRIVENTSALGFTEGNYVTHAAVIGGMLFWTDGNVSPKMLDIEKAYNRTNGTGSSILDTYDSITSQILEIIKYPPTQLITVEYEDDPDYKLNNLRGKLFQFKYRYTYDNNEESVFSAISELVLPVNETLRDGQYFEDQYVNNRLKVTFNTGSREVYKIDIAAREGNVGHWRIVKTFDKYDPSGSYKTDSDGNPLTANSDAVYYFYNNVIGKVLDQDDAARAFDYVPKKAGGLEIIEKNRLIMADITEGFDNVDIDVNLTHDSQWVNLGTDNNLSLSNHVVGALLYDKATVGTISINSIYRIQVLFLESGSPVENNNKYFYYKTKQGDTFQTVKINLINQINAYSGTIVAFDLYGSTHDSLYVLYRDNSSGSPEFYANVISFVVMNIGLESSFKAGAWQEFGLQYYDEQFRRGNVNISEDTRIYIPEYTDENGYVRVDRRNRIAWQINHSPPAQAKYYQWVWTKNTSMTRFGYYLIEESDVTTSGAKTAITINRTLEDTLDNNPITKRLLYTDWQQGDKIRFVAVYDTTSYTFPTLQTLKEYEISNAELDTSVDPNIYRIFLSNFDIDDITHNSTYRIIVEIYRPRKELPDEENDRIYYEYGPIYGITGGVHDTTSGWFESGDAYLRYAYLRIGAGSGTEVLMPCENEDYSDYYDSDVYNIGRANVIDKNAKEQRYKSDLRYGGVYVQNSQINDLCKFEAANYEELQEKWGAITKIVEIGYTLKVLQEYKVTPIFIGREGLQQARYDNLNIVVGLSEVLGSYSPSEERWGCQNPESVFVDGVNLYFADRRDGAIIRYAGNGMFPISDYGVKDYVRDTLYNLDTDATSTPRIIGYHDAKYDEVVFTFFKDYTGRSTHFSTIAFKETPANKWISFRSHENIAGSSPTCYASIGQDVISWNEGLLYLHNVNPLRNYFYDKQHQMSVEVVANAEPMLVKTFLSMGYVSNVKWEVNSGSVCEVTIKPNDTFRVGMYSELYAGDFEEHEGDWWAAFLSDMYTNANTGAPVADINDLYNGRELKGRSVKIKLKNDISTEVVLFSVEINSIRSR